MAEDLQARPATAQEIEHESQKHREELAALAPQIFIDNPREIPDLLAYFSSSLGQLQSVYAQVALRGALRSEEMLQSSVCFLIAAAVIRTMKNNPMYGTRALEEQLIHHFQHIARTGAAVGGVVFDRKKESTK